MNIEDRLQQNIRRTAALHALKKIGAIVDKENKADAASARLLHRLLRYGWIVFPVIAALLAHLTGVY